LADSCEVAMTVSLTVRMYRLHELGDCFLVGVANGTQASRILIDCGSFRNGASSKARLNEIVTDIARELRGAPLNVVVGTHQHNDHLSAFVHCEGAFRAIGVEEVWLSWLDHPTDRMARDMATAHKNLANSLYNARLRLRDSPLGARKLRALEVLDDMLGF